MVLVTWQREKPRRPIRRPARRIHTLKLGELTTGLRDLLTVKVRLWGKYIKVGVLL